MISPMTEAEAFRLLSICRVRRLGCVYEDGPYVVPINYVFDGESIFIHSLRGRKLETLQTNPRACLQVDEISTPYQWQSVIAYGVFEELSDSSERDRAARLILKRFPNLTPVESMPVHDGESSVIIFRLRVREVTGVAEKWTRACGRSLRAPSLDTVEESPNRSA
jgi:uncharacterized protein